MREILFRAKHIHAFNSNSYLDGQWVEGFLSAENYINDGVSDVLIDPNTICQYTGLTDKNGNKIWENDIVHIGDENIRHIIEWYDNGFMGKAIGAHNRIGLTYWQSKIEKMGNIFDNPDLLKGE